MTGSTQQQNSTWVLKNKPSGVPKESDFEQRHDSLPEVGDGKLLVKALFISVDPYLRHRIGAMSPGSPVAAGQVAEVLESRADAFQKGDIVLTTAPWATHSVLDASDKTIGLKKLPFDPKIAPASAAIGVLGMPGQTAYFGLKEVCQIKSGETLVVSGAAGAVGSAVGQLAKTFGARVIGVAGGKEKCEWVKSLGFDDVVDYKAHKDVASIQAALKEAAPKGVDAYFDNTGGIETHALWDLYNKYARVAICGQISIYNATEAPTVPNFLPKLIYKSVNIKGFVYSDYAFKPGRMEEFYKEMPKLVGEKKIQLREHIVNGFDKVPHAFISLFHGANTGKIVVKL